MKAPGPSPLSGFVVYSKLVEKRDWHGMRRKKAEAIRCKAQGCTSGEQGTAEILICLVWTLPFSDVRQAKSGNMACINQSQQRRNSKSEVGKWR